MQIITLTDVGQKHSWSEHRQKSPHNKSYTKRNVVDYAKPGPHGGQLNRFSFQRNN